MDDVVRGFRRRLGLEKVDSKHMESKHIAPGSEAEALRLTSVRDKDGDDYVKKHFPRADDLMQNMANARTRTLQRIAGLPQELGDKIFDATVRCSLPLRLHLPTGVKKTSPDPPLSVLASTILAGSLVCEADGEICEENGLYLAHLSWTTPDHFVRLVDTITFKTSSLLERVEHSILRSSEFISTVKFPSASDTSQLLYQPDLAPWSTRITALHLSVSLPFNTGDLYPGQLYAAQRALPRLRHQLPNLKKLTMTVVEKVSPTAHESRVPLGQGHTRGRYRARELNWASYALGLVRYTDIATELAKIVVVLRDTQVPSTALCFYGKSLIRSRSDNINPALIHHEVDTWHPQQDPRGDRKMPEGVDVDAIVAEVMAHEGYHCWL